MEQGLKRASTKTLTMVLIIAVLIGCSGYRIIPKQDAPSIPDIGYARIIKLDNPEGDPYGTLAGVVFVTGKATVCTDYPREETIKSLDDLTQTEKQAFTSFHHYAIADGGEILGYVSVPVETRAHIWRREDDPVCAYKVQIILSEHRMGHTILYGPGRNIINR